MRLAGAVCAVLAMLAPWWARIEVFPNGHPVLKHGIAVVGDHVVPGYAVGAGLLSVALALQWWPRSTGMARHEDPRPGRWLLDRAVLIASAVLAVLSIGGAVAADLLFRADYQVLAPDGPDDCRVVTREDAMLFSGSGDAYVIQGSGIARRVASWRIDDGDRAIENGTYDLAWGPGGGTLAVHGTEANPVDSTYRIDCG